MAKWRQWGQILDAAPTTRVGSHLETGAAGSGSNPEFKSPQVIRYGDDLVVLHADRRIVQHCQDLVSEWLKTMGLEVKPSKTRITLTLTVPEGPPGFDFLGFQIRQYPVGKTQSGKDAQGRLQGFKTHITPSKTALQRHVQHLREIIHRHRHVTQAALITHLNPVIRGWTQYYAHVVSTHIFQKVDSILYGMLRAWAGYRHPNKNKHWIMGKYWSVDEGTGWVFQPPNSDLRLYPHTQTPIHRHVKVQGARSPYGGDWVYWSARLGRHPNVPSRMARLLKRPQGRCPECGLFFMDGDSLEVDHLLPQSQGGTDESANLQLLHRHCHDSKTARDLRCRGPSDTCHVVEEPGETKVSCPVL